jgi:hypothetical protein
VDDQALRNADELIANLLTLGVDYSAHREQLATEIWWEGFWEGNSDITVDITGIRAIRCIQEDEYDQHVPYDEDRPSWDKMLFSQPEYTWFVDDAGLGEDTDPFDEDEED